MAMMFFLPNMLLSGFMFPFLGMPVVGAVVRRMPAADALHPDRPRDHAEGLDAWPTCTTTRCALAGLMLVAMMIAVTRFRRTLD